jgi:hypothetical protein
MTQTDQSADLLNQTPEEQKRPEMLNVLTILTFIGSGIGIISGIYGYFSAARSYQTLQDVQSKLEDAPAIVKSMTGPAVLELARKQLENRMPIMLLTLLGCALCIYGALRMRSLKKSGFSIYLIGELLPIIVSIIFLGMGSFGPFMVVLTLLFPIVFIILYATQLKNLA